jgi:hypothetical protein
MRYLLFIVTILTLLSCENTSIQSFQVKPPTDPNLSEKAQAYVPRLIKACPGLNRYAKDLTTATVGKSSMRDYEEGIAIEFPVVEKPQSLPAPLNVYSAQHHCSIYISKDGSRAYIAKRACHSICEGTWQDNSPDLMGREFVL